VPIYLHSKIKTIMKKVKLLMMLIAVSTASMNAQKLNISYPLSPETAVAMATREVSNVLSTIDPEDFKNYGFDAADDFSAIEIGMPFYQVTLSPTELNSTKEITTNTNLIQVPLLLNGTARCIILIGNEEGNWKVVGIGGSNYVTARQDIFASREATHQVIISVPQIFQNYLLVDGKKLSFDPIVKYEDSDLSAVIDLDKLVSLQQESLKQVNHQIK
jgi:hypothetical protein